MENWVRAALVASGGTTALDFEIGDFKLGHGANRYNIVWTQNPDGTVKAKGDQAFRLLSYMDIVWFWDWPTAEIIRTMRSYGQTKVGVVYAYECIPMRKAKHPGQELLRQVSLQHLLLGTDGKAVNPYYGSTKAVAAYVEIERPEYAARYLTAIEYAFSNYYRKDKPDVGCPDNLLERPYHGTAPNAPSRDAMAYLAAYENFITRHVRRIAPIFGNTDSTRHYLDVRWRYQEWTAWENVQWTSGQVPILSPLAAPAAVTLPTYTDGRDEMGYVACRSGSIVWWPD